MHLIQPSLEQSIKGPYTKYESSVRDGGSHKQKGEQKGTEIAVIMFLDPRFVLPEVQCVNV